MDEMPPSFRDAEPAADQGQFSTPSVVSTTGDDGTPPSLAGAAPGPSGASAPNFFSPTVESAAPNFFSPTFESAKADGSLDDVIYSKLIQADTDRVTKGERLIDGLFGYFGVADPSRQAEIIAGKEAELKAMSTMDMLGLIPSPARLLYGIATSGSTKPIPEALAEVLASQMGGTLAASRKKTSDIITAARKNPERGITDDTVFGVARAAADAGIQSVVDIPVSVVEGIGIGASVAGWSFGAADRVEDNSVQAVARWARAQAKAAFPGDPLRQEDFAVMLAQGVGSTAGFYGVHAGAMAAGLKTLPAMLVTGTIGGLATSPQTYNDALKSRKEGREVSELALALAYGGGLALGGAEALPIAFNIPLPAVAKSRVMALLQTVGREAAEEGAQELVQSVGQDLLAYYLHDPTRRVGDDASMSMLVGALSGGGIKAATFASKAARDRAVEEARQAGGMPPVATQATPQASPKTPGKGVIDLEALGNGFPAPQTPAPAASTLAPEDRLQFSDIRDSLPKNERGDGDTAYLYQLTEHLTGKRYWNTLDDAEREIVFGALRQPDFGRSLLAVDPAQVQAAAAGAVPTATSAATSQSAPPGRAASPAQTPAAPAAAGRSPATAPAQDLLPAGKVPDAAMVKQVQRETAEADEVAVLERARETSVPPPPGEDGQVYTLGSSQEFDRALNAANRELATAQAALEVAEANMNAAKPAKKRSAGNAFVAARTAVEDIELEIDGLTKGREQAAAAEAAQGDMFDPAVQAAQALYDAKRPAADWSVEAIVAGAATGLVRIDPEGVPRRAAEPEGPEFDPVAAELDDARRKMNQIARAAGGKLRPARFGEMHADGDPVAIRMLVEGLRAMPEAALTERFGDVARLTRARNHEVKVARVAQGLMAAELAAQDEDYKLSSQARDLIEQTVEDAFKAVPVEETVEKVAVDTGIAAVIDEVEKVTKHIDPVDVARTVGGMKVIVNSLNLDDLRAQYDAEDAEKARSLPEAGTLSGEEVDSIVDTWTYVQEMRKVPKPQRLNSFLRDLGGIVDEGGEISAILGKKRNSGGLINGSGIPLDEAARRAWDAGFITTAQRPGIATFLDVLRDDLNDSPVVRLSDISIFDDIEVAVEMGNELAELGVYDAKTESEVRARLASPRAPVAASESRSGAVGGAQGSGEALGNLAETFADAAKVASPATLVVEALSQQIPVESVTSSPGITTIVMGFDRLNDKTGVRAPDKTADEIVSEVQPATATAPTSNAVVTPADGWRDNLVKTRAYVKDLGIPWSEAQKVWGDQQALFDLIDRTANQGTWKEQFRDANAIMKLDDAGDVIGSVMFDGKSWAALDAEGGVIGRASSPAGAKILVNLAASPAAASGTGLKPGTPEFDQAAQAARSVMDSASVTPEAERGFNLAMQAARAFALRNGKKTGNEYGVMGFPNGKTKANSVPASARKASQLRVDEITAPEMYLGAPNSVDFHHNHPGSTSFSRADYTHAAPRQALRRTWVHGHNGSEYWAEFVVRDPVILGQAWDIANEATKGALGSDIDLPKFRTHLVAQMMREGGVIRYDAVAGFEYAAAVRTEQRLRQAMGDTWTETVAAIAALKETADGVLDRPARPSGPVGDVAGTPGRPADDPGPGPGRATSDPRSAEPDRREVGAIPSNDITVARTDESLVDGLIATYDKPVSDAARAHAVALERVGTDTKLFHDLKAKIGKLVKADIDAVSWLYGKAAPKRTKALQLDTIEAEFQKRIGTEADAATLSGNRAIVTRDTEANATDRRRAERDRRVRASETPVLDGIIPRDLQGDGEGQDAGGSSRGDGDRGEGDVRPDARSAESGSDEGTGVPGESGASAAGSDRGKRDRDERSDTGAAILAAKRQADKERKDRRRENYRITENDPIGEGGPKEKVRANIAAIRLVKELAESPDRKPTLAEKGVLVRYVGWGAFAQDVFATHKSEWAKERQELIDLMTAEEYASASASTLNAHYTSRSVIDAMWAAVEHLGFTGGRALEPSSGVGHFIGLTPSNLAKQIDWTAVELDTITGKIAKYLYEGSDVRISGFEKTNLPPNFFDLAISNVPFGNFTLTDRKYSKLLIHDYFFAKGLDLVRPGGIVGFITSAGTMDKPSTTARRLIASKADLVGAIRLPGGRTGAFAGNAGTEVTTDIIFLRKRLEGQEQSPETREFLDSVTVETPDGPTKINAYFAKRPEMMLGEMRLTGSMYRDKSPVLVGSTDNIKQRIIDAAQKMPANVFVERGTETVDIGDTKELSDAAVKEGAFFLKGGKLFQNVLGQAVAQNATGAKLKRARMLLDMRDIVNDIMAIQSGRGKGKAESLPALRKKLNTAYDAFVKAFGPINKKTISIQKRKIKGEEREITIVKFPNLADFRDDPDSYKVSAIENYDAENDTATKAAIFSADILQQYVRPDITGPDDALAVSLNETGKVDIKRIAEMMQTSEDEAAANLGERVFLNPDGEKHEISAVYLSGDVVGKLEQATAAAEINPAFRRNVTALEAVQPTKLSRVDIRTTFGAPWIPAEVLNAYIANVLNIRGEVRFEPITSSWIWTSANVYTTPSGQAAWGTTRAEADDIVIAALNSKKITVYDKDEKGNPVANRTATEDVAAKVRAVSEAFTGDPTLGMPGWVWEDEARAQMLEDLYNDKFNRLVTTVFDGSHLTLPGLATSIALPNGQTVPFSLRKHQKDVIWRAILTGNVLMDHAVGAGKTYAMIAAGMEMKRLGLIRRPMYTVPNHMLEQFSREFLQAYPNAKILVAEKKYMEAKNRKAFAARIAADNWDAIIITHSAFGKLPMSPEAYKEFLEEQKAEIVEAWLTAKGEAEDNGKPSRDPTVKQIERKKKAIKAKLDKLMATDKKDAGVEFEELGVDFLIVDEAHCFPSETLVDTDRGQVSIGEIVENKLPVRVRSVDHATGETVWRPVTQFWKYQKQQKKLVVIHTSSGQKVTCTTNHHVFVDGRGYVEAKTIVAGDAVRILRSGVSSRGLMGGQDREVLQHRVQSHGYAEAATRQNLSDVRFDVRSGTGNFADRAEVLQHRVLPLAPRDQRSADSVSLRDVQSGIHAGRARARWSRSEILLEAVQGSRAPQASGEDVRGLFQAVHLPQQRIDQQREETVLLRLLFGPMADGTAGSDRVVGGSNARRHEAEMEDGQGIRTARIASIIGSNEAAESNAMRSHSVPDGEVAFWSDVSGSGWQRTDDQATDYVGRGVGRGTDRVCDFNQAGAWAVPIAPEQLQGRRGLAEHPAGYRSGRALSSHEEVEVPGSTENRDTECSRVVRVEVLEPGSADEPASCCRPDQFVYDIGVEGEHNYFADGVLVHNSYKNLDYQSRHSNIKGIGVKGSERATDLFMKIRHIEKTKPGRSTIFATGTPMSRSMAEVYTMQRYLQSATLREYGIEKFDTWAATFGMAVTKTEQGVSLKLKDVTSFSKFINVPELSALYSRVTSSVTANDLNLARPELKGGQPQVVLAEMDTAQSQATDELIAKMEALKGPAEKGEDNHLSLFTKMLQVATDIRLYDPSAEFNPNGKIAKVVDNVFKIYSEGKAPALGQLIFSDMGPPSSRSKAAPAKKPRDAGDESAIDKIRDSLMVDSDDDADGDPDAEGNAEIESMLEGKFNLYQDIKDRLVARGVPAKEIAFIHDAKNDQQKAEMFKAMRAGKIRILLGSTAKMGVGTNVQRLLTALHHIDAPWNPADDEQRNGRILRQGNENKEISIFRYVTEGSADAYRWQILARKAEFIAQFRAGARGLRDAEDIDSPIPEASTLKALATGDTRIVEFAELTRELRVMEAAKRGHERTYISAALLLAETRAELAYREKALARYVQDAPLVTDLRGDAFKVRLDTGTLNGEVTERKAAGEAIRSQILAEMKNHRGRDANEIELGAMSGFKMVASARKSDNGIVVRFSLEGAASYQPADGNKVITGESDAVGIVRQFENILIGIPGVRKNTENFIARQTAELPRLEKQSVATPFPRALQFATMKARYEELEAALKPKPPEAPRPSAVSAITADDDDGSMASFVGATDRGDDVFARARAMEEAGKDRYAIWADTMAFRGADGQWLREVDDSQQRADAAPSKGILGLLQSAINMVAGTGRNEPAANLGGADGVGGIADEASDDPEMRDTSPVFGDVLARLTEKRLRMSVEERRARPPWEDYDVPEADQVVVDATERAQFSAASILFETEGFQRVSPLKPGTALDPIATDKPGPLLRELQQFGFAEVQMAKSDSARRAAADAIKALRLISEVTGLAPASLGRSAPTVLVFDTAADANASFTSGRLFGMQVAPFEMTVDDGVGGRAVVHEFGHMVDSLASGTPQREMTSRAPNWRSRVNLLASYGLPMLATGGVPIPGAHLALKALDRTAFNGTLLADRVRTSTPWMSPGVRAGFERVLAVLADGQGVATGVPEAVTRWRESYAAYKSALQEQAYETSSAETIIEDAVAAGDLLRALDNDVETLRFAALDGDTTTIQANSQRLQDQLQAVGDRLEAVTASTDAARDLLVETSALMTVLEKSTAGEAGSPPIVGTYLSRPEELFARAFEHYVAQKAIERGYPKDQIDEIFAGHDIGPFATPGTDASREIIGGFEQIFKAVVTDGRGHLYFTEPPAAAAGPDAQMAELRRTLKRELRNVQGRANGAAVGVDRQSGEVAEGAVGPEGAVEGRAEGARDRAVTAIVSDKQLADAFLSAELRPDAVKVRAVQQGFTTRATGDVSSLEAFPSDGTFGLHAALAPPAPRQSIGERMLAWAGLAPAKVESEPALRIRQMRSIRMPDIVDWHDPAAWATAMATGVYDGPELLTRFVTEWQAVNQPVMPRDVTDHRFSMAMADELSRLGYEAVVYRGADRAERVMVWEPERIRSADDAFHPDAVGEIGLNASEPFVEQDLRDRLNRMLREEGMSEEETTTFDDDGSMASLVPRRTNADGYVLMLPYEAEWGDNRFNPDDAARAKARMREVLDLDPATASWDDLVSGWRDANQIIANMMYFAPDNTVDTIRERAATVSPSANIPYSLLSNYAYLKRLEERRSMAEWQEAYDRNVFFSDTPHAEWQDYITLGRAIANKWMSVGNRPRLSDLVLMGDGLEPKAPKKRKRGARPGEVGETMKSGFYWQSGRLLKEIPDPIFEMGWIAVNNWMRQAGVSVAETTFLEFPMVDTPTTRDEVARLIAKGIFDFKVRVNRWNPERPRTGRGHEDGYDYGGTRAADGPRIPGRGIYLEDRLLFPKRLRGGAEFFLGQFDSYHWNEEGTWSSLRGSIREVPGFGQMLVDEKSQTFFEQSAAAEFSPDRASKFTPETPIDETYVRVMARQILLRAVKENVDSIGISTIETTARIQANASALFFYGQIVPSLQKELRRISGDGSLTLQQIELPKAMGAPKREKPYTVWAVRIPDNVRRQIKANGLPMMNLAPTPAGNQRLTAQAQAKYPAIAADLEQRLRRMLPADVAVEFAHRLFDKRGRERYGQFRPDIKLIEVALSRGADQAMMSGAHEVVHALREADAFTDAEWALLVERARKVGVETAMDRDGVTEAYRDMFKARARKMGLAKPDADAFVQRMMDEELVARLAEQYFGPQKARFGATIDALLQRIGDILDAIAAAFNGQGFMSADAVFRRMERGALAKRVQPTRPGPARSTLKTTNADDVRAVSDLWSQAALADGDNLSSMEKAENIVEVQAFLRSFKPVRRPITAKLDVVAASGGSNVTYFVVPKGRDAYDRGGSRQSVAEFIVKPARRKAVRGVEVTNASVTADYQRQGIATAVYDMIAEDMASVGGLSPTTSDSLEPGGRAFWSARDPNLELDSDEDRRFAAMMFDAMRGETSASLTARPIVMSQSVAEAAVDLGAGRRVASDPQQINRVLRLAATEMKVVPDNVQIGAVQLLTPVFSDGKFTGLVDVRVAGPGGRSAGTFRIAWNVIRNSSAVYHRQSRTILFNTIPGVVENQAKAVPGEVWHESVHSLWDTAIVGEVRDRLLGHAKLLKVLDIDISTYSQAKGSTKRHAAGSVLEAYDAHYAGLSDKADRIDQEYVAFMMELYKVGFFTRAELEPVIDLVDAFEQGLLTAQGEAVERDQVMAAIVDADTGRSMRRDLDALGYYSGALEAAKGLKQAKGTPEQMLAQLKAGGAKQNEIEATNLAQFLDGKKSVTRDEIVNHLTQNRVGVKEVVNKRGETPSGARGFRDDTGNTFDKDQTGFTLFPLTEKVKASVRDDGLPMFALAGNGDQNAEQPDMTPTTRPFAMEGYEGSVTTTPKQDGLRTRVYTVSTDGQMQARIALSEREPNLWEIIGVRLDKAQHGKGLALRAIEAIERDAGAQVSADGIITPETYQQIAAVAPDSVRFHVRTGAAFDGLYMPHRAIEMMRNAAADAAVASPTDDAARDREALRGSEATVPDDAYRVDRIIAGMERQGLDMSPGARKARAEEMGFDTATTWYHGTAAKFDAFDPAIGSTPGIWMTLNKKAASGFGDVGSYFIKAQKFGSMQDFMAARVGVAKTGLEPGSREFSQAVVDRLVSQGFDGIRDAKFKGAGGVGEDVVMMLRPENIRSVNADFDPNETDSDNILAALAPIQQPPVPRPRPPQLPQLGDTTKSDTQAPEQGLSDLIAMLKEAIGIEERRGRLNPGLKAAMGRLGAKLYGQFSRRTGIVRTAIPNDIQTLAHQGGHALETNAELAPYIEALKQVHFAELVPLATPGNDQLSEGWAEFFRLYVIDPTTARTMAPGITREFRNMLEKNRPEMLTALDAVQVGYAALQAASPAGVVKSRVQSTVRPTTKIGKAAEEIREKGFRGATSDWLYQATTGLLDDKNPLKVAVKFLIEEATRNLGSQIKAGEQVVIKALNDPYKLARMMEHARVHATAILRRGVVGKGRTLPRGPSMQDVLTEAFGGAGNAQWNEDMAQTFGAFLVSRRMNAEWDRFDNGFLDAPPDHLISRQAWANAQNDLEKAYPQFRKAARMLDQFNANLLELKFQNGFLTQDQYDDFRFRDGYVPLQRIMDQDGPSSLNAKGDNRRKMIFRFKGSTRDFVNPIESIVADVYRTKARIELNDVIGSLDRLAQAAGPNGGRIAERIPRTDMRARDLAIDGVVEKMKSEAQKIIAKTGLNPWDAQLLLDDLDQMMDAEASKTLFQAVETSSRLGERIVYLWEDGKRVPILLGADQLGEDIFNIFTSVGKPGELDYGLESVVFFTQAFRAGVTKSPAYVVVNWFRDQMATWVLSRDFTPFWTGLKGLDIMSRGGAVGAAAGFAAGAAAGIATGGVAIAALPLLGAAGGAIAGSKSNVVATPQTSKDAQARYDYFAGMMGGIDANLIDTVGQGRDVMQLRKSGFTAAPTTWQSMLRTMEITEAASRIGHMEQAYQRMLRDGMTEEEAAFEAAFNSHDVMDFSRRGSRMMTVSRLVAFLNAQMQGLSAALRTMRGERDTYVNMRDAITPYIKATQGMPLSIGEKEALPNSQRIYLKMASIGLIGLALILLYQDDPEHEELRKGDMAITHWFFKANGVWWRLPKPFELAVFSNLFEAMFDGLVKQDPMAKQRFAKSLREMLLVAPEIPTFRTIETIYNTLITTPLDSITGKSQYDRNKSDLPLRLQGLPPEMQYDAYSSEFSKLLARNFGMSPYKTDNLIKAMFASVGRDMLTATDAIIPALGFSKGRTSDKSFEDYVFISRIARRSSRGAYSTSNFWAEMTADGGLYVMAAKGYERFIKEIKSPREAQEFLQRLDPDRKAYALLQHHYEEKDQDMHPLNRARQVISAITGLRRQMADDTLYVEKSNKKGRDAEKIVNPASTQRVVNEILEEMSMREARNAQIVLGKPGWANSNEMRTEGLWSELQAAAPAVAEELWYRLTNGRNKVYSYDAVKAVWPDVKKHLLTEEPDSSMARYRIDARSQTPRSMPQQ